MGEHPRIVIVAAHVPDTAAENAGMRYLTDLVTALGEASVTVIAPDMPVNRRAMRRPCGVPRLLLPVTRPGAGFFGAAKEIRHRLAPVCPPHGFVYGLEHDAAVRAALRAADVVDLQWPMMGALVTRVRRLAPRARMIVTLHDVASQRYRRALKGAQGVSRSLRLAANVVDARWVERRVARHADTVIAFSEKDVALMPRAARASVINPPIAAGVVAAPRIRSADDEAPIAVVVGPLTRAENLDGARWAVRDVWPAVRRAVPRARVVFAGRADDAHRDELQRVPGVEVRGFVDDLDALYASASVVLAPLRHGAGVKFKVLDALARGVPVVTTSVGAEGIGDPVFTPRAYDRADDFARAVVQAMRVRKDVRQTVQAAARWARERYGEAQFARAVAAVYGVSEDSPVGGLEDGVAMALHRGVPFPCASVVIPVRDGEHGIARQLAALAREPEAHGLEVIVADNGSTDRTTDVARAFATSFGTLRVVDASQRPGVNHARNMGLFAATAEHVLICDHDDEIRPGWIAAMLGGLHGADVVGGRVVPRARNEAAVLGLAIPEDPRHVVFGYLPYVVGACLGVRRAAAIEVGGFDEAFAKGHDEVDFCWRLQQAGYTLGEAPGAVVDYWQRDTARAAARQTFHSARTQILLWQRHHNSADLAPVSFRAAVRNFVLASVHQVPRLWSASTRFGAARALGWVSGTVFGHLRYRIVGDVPPAVTPLHRGRLGD